MNVTWRILIILAAVAISLGSFIPPKEKLGLGKDLAGGTTITYRILPDADGNPPTQQTMNQIISVIRQRIDPQGIFDISIVPQGTSQLEITMPAPTPEVKKRRKALDDILDEIGQTAISEAEVDAALRLSEHEREERFDRLSQGVPERKPLLEDAANAYQQMQSLRDQYEQMYAGRSEVIDPFQQAVDDAQKQVDALREELENVPVEAMRVRELLMSEDEARRQEVIDGLIADYPAHEDTIKGLAEANRVLKEKQDELQKAREEWRNRIRPVEDAAANAQLEFEKARQAVLATSLEPEEVRRALDLSQEMKTARDPATGEIVSFPSPREQAISRLKEQFPLLAAKIDQAVAAHNAYKEVATGYDDPKDLINLLKGAGVLSFHIAAAPTDSLPIATLRKELRDGGPGNVQSSTQVRWFKIDKLEQWYETPGQLEALQADPYTYFLQRQYVAEQFDGEIYLLLWVTSDRSLDENSGSWELTRATRSQDQTGRPAVAFQLDAKGASLFRSLTTENKGRGLSIVLDDRVYSAPTIQSAIGASGQITGEFSQKEIEYLLRVLNAGTLQAKLKGPVAQSTIGPALGADNLRRGLEAGILALIVVGVFMIVYYFFAGVVANVALICNAIFILGIMALYQAAFTMPGIAGIVLTFGMAVDSNVLIYERIREELDTGVDLKTAIRLGFEKVLSTIVDANVTNLIVCFVLGFTATAEVKGFALTLGIGIISTLFCALFVTRVIFDLYADVLGAKSLPMLPSVWRLLHNLLNPKIEWVRWRVVFWTIGVIVVISGIAVTDAYWNEMLDTVFKGGTSVTISFKKDADGNPIMKPRAEVENAIENYARDAFDKGEINEDVYNAIKNVSVVNYNVDEVVGADFRGNQFVIKSTLEDTDQIETIIHAVFGDQLATRQPLEFDGADQADVVPADIVFPILEPELGKNINEPTAAQNVRRYLGGVAIVLNDITPPATEDEVFDRVERLHQSEEYKRYGGREIRVIPLKPTGKLNDEGDPLWSEVVVLVNSPNISIFQDRDAWDREVAQVEWQIVRRALTEPPSLDEVTKIGAEVAQQFRAKAIVAITLSLLGILVYIWFRFGSFRYSAAAILALVHDVFVTLGLLAATHAVYDTHIGQMLYVEPFQIDLGVIAALLTIIGYSLNDTIVILDRVRENRGKLAITSADVVNKSINQTMSRTFLTSGTTLLAIIILYIEGGTGVRPFAYAMLCGVVTGTWSSVAIAAPMVCRWGSSKTGEETKK